MLNHDTLLSWIQEREAIRLRRLAGQPPPWSSDKILQSYRFTNVRREHDAVTQWLHTHWYAPNQNHPDLWFAALVARQVNAIPALAALPFPLPWDPEAFLRIMKTQKYGRAYLIRPDPRQPGLTTAKHQVLNMFNPSLILPTLYRPLSTLAATHALFDTIHAVGSFLAQQMVADLSAYLPLSKAIDKEKFCAPGPGSLRYLNLIHGLPLLRNWPVDSFCEEVWDIRDQIRSLIGLDLISMDVTNCMCEASKYILATQGKMPKRRYTP